MLLEQPHPIMNGYGHGYDAFDVRDHAYVRTRNNRILGAMFPEIENDEFEDDQVAQTSTTLSIIEMLAEPCQHLKDAVIDLLHVEGDDPLDDLPALIRRLHDPDPAVVAQAAQMIYLLSKEDRSLEAIIRNEQLVNALVHASKTNEDNHVRGKLAATLCQISNHQQGRISIFRSGGIAELVRMLRSHIDSVVHYAITTLHNLLLYIENAKQETIACGGLEALVPLLRSPNQKLQALVADSLYFLLIDRPECKTHFLSLQGPLYLVNILGNYRGYMKLLYAVIRCIRSISTSIENKASLINLQAIEALYNVMPIIEEDRRQLALLIAIRNLSDAATNLSTLSPLVISLLQIIQESRNEEIVSCCCGILSNLTCNNSLNKETVVTSGGIAVLANALVHFTNIEDITEPTLCTMRHCTARHQYSQEAQDEVRKANAHCIILALLATRRPPIVKAALGLVRNCALSDVNLQSLISERTVENDTIAGIAIDILRQSGTILQQDFMASEDGVSMTEMVEGAVSALHQLARNKLVARQIYTDFILVDIITKLLSFDEINSNEDDLMMREILGLIYQLTKSSEGATAVELSGPTPYIVDALQSKSKPVRAYASIILKNMGVDKPIEYRRRLQAETAAAGMPHTNEAYSGENEWMNDGLEPELFNEMYNYASLDLKHVERDGSWYDTDL
jgi:hypothetical protein